MSPQRPRRGLRLADTHIDSHVAMRTCTTRQLCARSEGRTRTHSASSTHKMIGPSSGTFSVPFTSIRLKKVVMADLARMTKTECEAPNGMMGTS